MSNRLLRNITSGVLAQAWTALLGLVILPLYVRRLGPSGYGLLALCLTLVGVGGLTDLGIGRSLGKYIAAARGEDRDVAARAFFRVGFTAALVLGSAICLLILVFARALVLHLFHAPPRLQGIAVGCLDVTAVGFPAILVRMSLEGLLTGYERIAFVNFTAAIANTFKAGLGAAAVLLGYSLPVVLAANIVVGYIAAGLLILYARRHLPKAFSLRWQWDGEAAWKLFHLGGISTACVAMALGLLYLDRFVIAAFLPFVWVGYYTACYDLTSRQWVISINVCQSILPVFSDQAANRPHELEQSYRHSSRGIAAATTGLAAILAALAHPILAVWYGGAYAQYAVPAMMWLSFGILLNSYISLPYTLVFSGVRSPAIYLAIYGGGIVIHFCLSVLLLHWFRIGGVAAAFCTSYLLVWVASLWWVRQYLVPLRLLSLLRNCFAPSWLAGGLVGAATWIWVRPQIHNLLSLFAGSALAYGAYAVLLAFIGFSRAERSRLWNVGLRAVGMAAKA